VSAWTQACCTGTGVAVGCGADVGLGLGASVGEAVAGVLTGVGEAPGVGDFGADVGVAGPAVGDFGTGVTVAPAARARAGNCRPTNPETLRRRKKWRRGSMGCWLAKLWPVNRRDRV
jgi:hypothetical protein